MFKTQFIQILSMLNKKPRKNLRKDYKTWIRKQPCILTGLFEVDPHHLKGIKYGSAMGLKSNDEFIVPIMHELHQELHLIGIDSFQEKYDICLEDQLIELHKRFMKIIVGDQNEN